MGPLQNGTYSWRGHNILAAVSCEWLTLYLPVPALWNFPVRDRGTDAKNKSFIFIPLTRYDKRT